MSMRHWAAKLMWVCGAAVLVWPGAARAQEPVDAAVMVSATVRTNPPAITLTWPSSPYAASAGIAVYRKPASSLAWGVALTNLPAGATRFTDTAVSVGPLYEYRLDRIGGGVKGYGFICSGIRVPAVESRGKIVLLVDNSFTNALAVEIGRLVRDLAGDGWTVLMRDVSRDDTPPNIKAIIKAAYDADPATVKAVFLFGHIPVVRSGWFAPDGHDDHINAWPADVYYGDMDGVWTDTANYGVNSLSGSSVNIPGDGRFDQSSLPSSVELQVGRVDLSDLPTFPKSEQELLRQYLDKDHDFRHGLIATQARGFVDDNFGYFSGEAFAANGWRNFAPCFGATNVVTADWTTQPSLPYLWGYGCGPGGPNSAGGVANTPDMLTHDPAVFTMLFGSYFGEWSYQDDLMRAALATAHNGLTCAWAGRPHWVFHRMAMGEPIGESTRLTQNSPGSASSSDLSYPPVRGRGVHVALMGDPTLRLHPVAPPAGLDAVAPGDGVDLAWQPSPEPVLGYRVYRSATFRGPFARISDLVPGTAFHDSNPAGDASVYMVRAIKLTESASGSYFNLSQGVCATATGSGLPPPAPTGLAASDGAYTDRVRLTWEPSVLATAAYEIWRSATNAAGTAAKIAESSAASFDDLTTPERVRYFYWVRARNGAGASGLSASDRGYRGVSPPRPPLGLAASDGTFTNMIRVTWIPLAGEAATYEVWRSLANNAATATRIARAIAGTRYDDTTVPSPSSPCFYWVTSVKASVPSAFGVADRGFLRLVPPVARASRGTFTDRVRVTWTPSPGATSYELWRAGESNPASASVIARLAATNYFDTGASPSGYQFYWVKAVNALSTSALSAARTGWLGLPAPDSLYASDGSSTDAVSLSWQGVSGASGYEVWRNGSGQVAGAIYLAGVPLDRRFSDSNTAANVTYYYWVRATNFLTVGPFGGPDSGFRASAAPPAVPPAPASVAASDGLYSNLIHVSWSPSTDAAAYEVWQGGSTNVAAEGGWVADATGTNCDLSWGAPGLLYFQVRARNAAGAGDFSAADSGFVALPAPADVRASDGTRTDQVSVTWAESDGANGFEVWRSATNEPLTALRLAATTGVLSYADSNALPGRVYYYWVKGTNDYGASDFGKGDGGYRAIAAPPANLTASDGAFTHKVRVCWSPSAGASSYEIWRGASTNTAVAGRLGVSAGTNYDDSGVAPGVTWYYWARAVGGGVTSDFSLVDGGYAWRDVTPPPARVQASDGTYADRVRVSWTAAASPVGAYQVWRSVTNDAVTATLRAAVGNTATQYDDTATAAGTTYLYWVRVRNAAGLGGWSVADSGWRGLLPPANVQASDGTYSNAVHVAWDPSPDAAAYEVWRGRLDSETSAVQIARTAATNFDDVGAVDSTTWFYRIKARNSVSVSPFSLSDSGWRAFFAPSPDSLRGLASQANPASVFAIQEVRGFRGSNQLTWCAFNDGDNTAFDIERRTSLTSGTWQRIATNVPRTPPTNIWWDLSPPATDSSFYRIVATNSAVGP